MMVPDPLRSPTDVHGAEDTSLAMPSDKSLSSGQQRVLSQVFTMKRGKSRYSKKDSTSPTSSAPQTFKTYNDFGTFKFKGGSTYNRTNSTVSAGFKGKSRSLTTKSTRGRYVSSNTEQVGTSSWPKSSNGLKPSRSDPALFSGSNLASAPSMKVKGQAAQSQHNLQTQSRESHSLTNGMTISSQKRIVRPSYSHSQTDGKLGLSTGSKIEQTSMVNNAGNMSNLQEAEDCLLSNDDSMKIRGANLIQHFCYNNDSAKDQVSGLGGIAELVNMLESINPMLNLAASGALRNLVFKNSENKKSVQKYGGIAKVLNLMKRTESSETKRQLAGLLWNLSSADELKHELLNTALLVLTKNVVVPYVGITENDEEDLDPEVFYCATGCLRNLSSSQNEEHRQKMRNCRNLIDSLMKHIKSCLAEEKPDDKSVENCMCILQNLTYQLWIECPEASKSYNGSTEDQSEGKKSPTVGCISSRSRKARKEVHSDPPEDSFSSVAKGLWDLKTIDMYVSLLSSASSVYTRQACLGALQNLTSGKEKGPAVVSENLLPKLYDEFVMPVILKSKDLQSNIYPLLDNMSRKPSLHFKMAKTVLPELLTLLKSKEWREKTPSIPRATACTIVSRLLLVDQEISKKAISTELVSALSEMSKSHENDPSIAASKLLHSLWKDKFLQNITKKLKLSKQHFVNERTIEVLKTEENPPDQELLLPQP